MSEEKDIQSMCLSSGCKTCALNARIQRNVQYTQISIYRCTYISTLSTIRS